ncbi:MAG: hypothetical protein AABZ60_24510 [Planctomycetota bacterium]
MSLLKEGLWLFSTFVWEKITSFLDRVGIIEKKPFVTITCPMEGHPDPR